MINAYESGMAVNKHTGKTIWTSKGNTGNNSTPVPFIYKGKRHLALFGQQFVRGIVPENGKVVWSYPWHTLHGLNAADPAISENRLFISSSDNGGCALLDISKGKPVELWRNGNLNAHVCSPIILGDYVYGIDGDAGKDAKLVCMALRDGSIRWMSEKTGSGNMIIAGGFIIMINETGTLFVIEANPDAYRKTGSKKKVLAPICLTAPVLFESTLYLRNGRGDLISIDISE